MRPPSVWMRKHRSRRSTARIRYCHSRRDAPNGTALSTSGTRKLSLYAAFDTKTGEVLGKTAVRHTSAEFVAFLADIVVNQSRGKEIHVIADNQSAHKSRPVTDFLAAS